MGKRGAKQKFTDISCPNEACKLYGISGKGNIIGNGTYQVKNKRVRKLSAAFAAESSMIVQRWRSMDVSKLCT